MQIELRDGVRAAVIDGVDYPLPAYAQDATVNAWYNGEEYKVICVPNSQAEPIPAQAGFKKVFTLPLPYDEAAQHLEQMRFALERKKLEIEKSAEDAFSSPVEVDGILWRGGKSSAESIKSAVDMLEFAGQTSVTLRDVDRNPHVYTLESAKSVAAQIGFSYQQKWQAEEQALLQLQNVDLSASDALDQINAITLEM